MTETPAERSYIAFISYRHMPLDKEAAERIQKKIENYTVPKEYREKIGDKKLGAVFRDEDELPASSSLTDSIYYALDHSEFLIVICTPDLPKSKWCEAEIRYFLKTHDRDHVLAVLADGMPEESFSPFLLHDFDEEGNPISDLEPLAANIAGENHTINRKSFNKETTRICAALIGCPFDALWQRERRARTNRLLTAAAGAVAVMAVFLGVVLNRNAQIAAQSAQITAQNDELISKNQEIEQQNAQIEEHNTALQRDLSSALVDSGFAKLERFDTKGALQDALSAMESNDPTIYDHRAENLLSEALGAYNYFQIRNELVYEQSVDISDMLLNADESLLYLLDEAGVIRALDTADYSVKWEYSTGESTCYLNASGLTDRLIIKTEGSVICLSSTDGSVLWQYTQRRENWFQCLSEDGAVFAILDHDEEFAVHFSPVYAIFLDTTTGKELGRCELSCDGYQFKWLYTSNRPKDYGAGFSPDHSKFVISFLADAVDENAEYPQKIPLGLIDLNSFEATWLGAQYGGDAGYGYLDAFFGLATDNDGSFIFLAQNNPYYTDLLTISSVKTEAGYQNNLQTNDFEYGVASGRVSIYEAGVIDQIYRTPPMLTSETRAIVFADRTVFIFDKKENELLRHIELSSPILYAYWVDKEAMKFALALENGSMVSYDLGTEKLVEDYGSFDLDQGDISLIQPLSGGCWTDFKDGAYLTVPKGDSNRVILCRFYNDPHAEALAFDSWRSIDLSSDLPYGLLTTYSDPREAVLIDRATLKEIKRSEITDFSSGRVFLLDDNHFQNDGKIYSFGGTYRSLDQRSSNACLRLKDGSLLTINQEYPSDEILNEIYPLSDQTLDARSNFRATAYPKLWLGEEGISLDPLSENPLLYNFDGYVSGYDGLSYNYHFFPGENGLVAFYGKDIWLENGELKQADAGRFSIYNVFTHTLAKIECPAFDPEGDVVAMGTEEEIFAVADKNGEVHLYDLSTSQETILPRHYAANEIISMGFSEGDDFLLIITSIGRLDIMDCKTLNQEFSESVPVIEEDIENFHVLNAMSNYPTFPGYNVLKAASGASADTLYITAGNWSSNSSLFLTIDTKAWILKASALSIFAIDPVYNTLLIPTNYYEYSLDNQRLLAFPVYTLEDLKEWANEVLAE